MDFKVELSLAVNTARKAGALLLERQEEIQVLSQQGKDIKLAADQQSEDLILRELNSNSAFPILAEERGSVGDLNGAETYWVVDPLDGTMNYSRGNVCYSVSVGLWHRNEPLLGVVYAPSLNEEYSGLVGFGAFCNDRPMSVRASTNKGQSILATGFPAHRNYNDSSLRIFIEQVQAFKKIRMIGSAALGLAWVASGQFDIYLEEGNMLWDVGAGLALVKAAGGAIRYQANGKPYGLNIQAAGNEVLF
jgi:myo-inositol-1(or 4)-monophosphatase